MNPPYKGKIMLNKRAFTLMEILFVLLVIALIVSFALPALRTVRFDIKNSRAKAAVKKMAEARRSYYQYMRGGMIEVSSFNAETMNMSNASCVNNLRASGKPGVHTNSAISDLFGCGFLDWKDFSGLPYTFYICDLNVATELPPCRQTGVYAGAVGNSSAGSKYSDPSKYYLYVDNTMQVKEYESAN